MPYAVSKAGRRIHYETFGDAGPTVVLIMGIGVSSRFWLSIPKNVAERSDHPYRVIAVDNRGTGQSDRPFTPFLMRHLADDVITVLDALKIEKADVVGISMGGMIAQHVALRHPARVSGLVLLCTMPGLPFGKLPTPWAISTLVRGFAKGMRGPEFMKLVYPESQFERVRELVKQGIWKDVVKNERFDMRTMLYHLIAIAGHSTGHRLSRIQCPTVIVTGDADVLIPPENSARMARRIRGAVLRSLPEVGHDLITLAPEAVDAALRELRAMRGLATAAHADAPTPTYERPRP